MDQKTLTLVEHLDELRKRIIIIIVAIVVGAGISYHFINDIITWVIEPAKDLDFIYLTPAELFLAYIKTSLIAGVVLALPVVLYQIWRFVLPGIGWKQKLYMVLVNLMSMVFFVAGAFFAYRIIVPLTLDFFTKFSRTEIEPLFSFASYTGFLGSLLLSFGLAFQLPILILLLTQFNLITPMFLKKFRKIFILVIFVAAAVLTPPDIISQGLLALPMIFLLELSIMISSLIYRRKK